MTLTHPPISHQRIPPLQNGERLSRSEYFRRYNAMPANVKAERIEEIVYMAAAAAVSADFHGQAHIILSTWLGCYWAATPGVSAADNSTILLDTDNDPQPDACLYILPSHGGRIRKNSNRYIVGAPDLVVEVAASSLNYDLGTKLNVYRRNGVCEYLVYHAYEGEFDWFVLRDGQYERTTPDAERIYRSETFPGLWLGVNALIAEEPAEVLAGLQRGVATPEHGEFVKQLESQKISEHT
jgi:Uma2 family endonuclease